MKVTVKIDEQSYDVEIGDLDSRPILATVEGETFEIWPEETAALPTASVLQAAPAPRPTPAAPRPAPRQAPAAPVSANGAATVSAPLPGVIISVAVKPGDVVEVGQELLTLEAMKMKNSIRANRAGKVANVFVAAGDHVKHGQALVEFAD